MLPIIITNSLCGAAWWYAALSIPEPVVLKRSKTSLADMMRLELTIIPARALNNRGQEQCDFSQCSDRSIQTIDMWTEVLAVIHSRAPRRFAQYFSCNRITQQCSQAADRESVNEAITAEIEIRYLWPIDITVNFMQHYFYMNITFYYILQYNNYNY